MSTNITIATGFWKNHSFNGWKASTLTLGVRDGAILISALATFITIVGGRFWAIVAFAVHQMRSSNAPKDGLHHQHQVVYRNNSSAIGASWQVFQIACSWGSNARRSLLRSIAFVLPPIICFLGFTAAGILSAKVAAPSYSASHVRIRPTDCGYWTWAQPSDADNLKLANRVRTVWLTKNSISAKNYARSCYGSSREGVSSCDTFPAASLPYSTRSDAPCPFEVQRCLLGSNTAFEMETDWLDSHVHFGVNAAPEDRVKYRKVVTCSVLNITNLISTKKFDTFTEYYYRLGPSYIGQETYRSSDTVPNDNVGYTLWAFTYLLGADSPTYTQNWTPNPDFNKTNADTSVFFLGGNSVSYYDPVDDPYFSAHRILDGAISNTTIYTSDSLNTAMACTDQYQMMDPTTNIATALGSWLSVWNGMQTLGLNTRQLAVADRLMISASYNTIFNSVEGLQALSLKAQESVSLLLAPAVPSNQWQIEAAGWFDTALAGLQSMTLSFASKNASGLAPWATIEFPVNEAMLKHKEMCDEQIVRNIGAYQSFSMLGIGIIFGVGLFIILVSLVLQSIVGAFQKRGWGSRLKQISWNTDSILHQQRIAFEGQGAGGIWTKTSGAVPITGRGELLLLEKQD